jgi:lipid-binding SYLF domain-containing protein
MLLIAAVVATGCSTTPKSAEKRDEQKVDADHALRMMKLQDPSLEGELEKAYGYAIFPSVGKGGFIVGGALGHGRVYEQGEFIGYCKLSQGTVGAQIGGQAYHELLLFEYKEAMDHFKTGNFALAAQVSAVAITAGASADADYDRGVKVLTMARGGAMLEASVGGQKFDYEPK